MLTVIHFKKITISMLLASSMLISCKRQGSVAEGEVQAWQMDKGDTLSYRSIELVDSFGAYAVAFKFVQFEEEYADLNLLLTTLVFDSTGSAAAFLAKGVEAYNYYFLDAKPEDVFGWRDEREVEIIFNSDKLISFVYTDFSWRSGGAIGFGEPVCYNYDLMKNRLWTFEALLDVNKKAVLSELLEEEYRSTLSPETRNTALIDLGWDSDTMPVSQNVLLEENGIRFYYNRFESNPFPTGLTILVPYHKLNDILLKNTIVTQHLNR
jgi:hypothetical protein